MPRAVQEWIAKTPDDKVPPRVKLRIWRRQCGDDNFAICPLSKRPLRADDPKHLHHDRALILGGEHREFNLVYVHASANLEQAKIEVAERAKNDDRAKRHTGIDAGRPTALEVPPEVRRARRERRSAESGKTALRPRPMFVEV